jgi:hypothetical protein
LSSLKVYEVVRGQPSTIIVQGSGWQIASYNSYVEASNGQQVLTSNKAVAMWPESKPASVTLVITDNRRLTDFDTVNSPGISWTSAPRAAQADPGNRRPAVLSRHGCPDGQGSALGQGPTAFKIQ